MATARLQTQTSVDELLNGISQLETSELERLTHAVIALRANRQAPSVPKSEAELLQKINQGLSAEQQRRYDELMAKHRKGAITVKERETLLDLIELVEENDARRVNYLAELAQLRGVTLPTVMKQLGIKPKQFS